MISSGLTPHLFRSCSPHFTVKLWFPQMFPNFGYGRQIMHTDIKKQGLPQMSANRPSIWFTGIYSIVNIYTYIHNMLLLHHMRGILWSRTLLVTYPHSIPWHLLEARPVEKVSRLLRGSVDWSNQMAVTWPRGWSWSNWWIYYNSGTVYHQ